MRLLAFILAFLLLASTANAATISAMWTAPTSGTTVVHYVMAIESWATAGGDTTEVSLETPDDTPELTFEYTDDNYVRCRVAGVDAEDRQGPYSQWSEVWFDEDGNGIVLIPPTGLVARNGRQHRGNN